MEFARTSTSPADFISASIIFASTVLFILSTFTEPAIFAIESALASAKVPPLEYRVVSSNATTFKLLMFVASSSSISTPMLPETWALTELSITFMPTLAAAIRNCEFVATEAPTGMTFDFSVDVADTLISLDFKILEFLSISAVILFLKTLTTTSPLTPAPLCAVVKSIDPATARFSLLELALTSISSAAVIVELITFEEIVS